MTQAQEFLKVSDDLIEAEVNQSSEAIRLRYKLTELRKMAKYCEQHVMGSVFRALLEFPDGSQL